MEKENITELLKNQASANNPINVTVDYQDNDVVFIESLDKLPELYINRLKANIICTCRKGKMEIDVADSHYVINPGEVFVCPSGMLVENVLVTPDFQFAVLCLTDRIIQQLLSSNVDFWNRAVYVRKEHIIKASQANGNANLGYHFYAIINGLINREDFPFREEMIRTMLQLLLLGFCSRQKTIEDREEHSIIKSEQDAKSPQAKVIFKNFINLIRNEEVKHQPVYYYADKLCISAKYLSHVCKEISGKSANEFIQMAVVEEVTALLRSSTLTVKEISCKMGFPNISFFGKYVKSHLGMSPNAYRKKIYEEKI